LNATYSCDNVKSQIFFLLLSSGIKACLTFAQFSNVSNERGEANKEDIPYLTHIRSRSVTSRARGWFVMLFRSHSLISRSQAVSDASGSLPRARGRDYPSAHACTASQSADVCVHACRRAGGRTGGRADAYAARANTHQHACICGVRAHDTQLALPAELAKSILSLVRPM